MPKNSRWKQKQDKKVSIAPEVIETPDSSHTGPSECEIKSAESNGTHHLIADTAQLDTNSNDHLQRDSEESLLDESNGHFKVGNHEQPSIESLRSECDDLRAQLIEKDRLLSMKHAELLQNHTALVTKTTELLTVQSHVYEIETHIQLSSKELQELSLSSSDESSDVSWDNSHRMKVLINLLSTLKAQVKSQSEEIVVSNGTIDTLHGTIATLRHQIQLLEAENKEISDSANAALMEKDTQLEDSNREIEHLHNGLKSLQSQFVQLEKENKRARQHLLELSENGSESANEQQQRIELLTDEVNKLQLLVDQLEADKEELMNEQKVSLESSLRDLEMFRNELSDTIAELDASNSQIAMMQGAHQREMRASEASMEEARHTIAELERYIAASGGDKERLQVELTEHLHESDVKCSALTQQCEDLQQQLHQQTEQCQLVKDELDRVLLALKDSRDELFSTKQALSEGAVKYEQACSSYQSEIDRLTGELTVTDAVQAALRSDNDNLKRLHSDCDAKLAQMQSDLSDAHAASIADYLKQIDELQHSLRDTESSYSAKVNELTASLQKASDALATHLNEESHVIRNSERLIALLEASLASKEKELSSVQGELRALELKMVDLASSRAAAEARLSDTVNVERLSAATQKELSDLRQELESLKARNAELQSSNNQHLEQLVQLQRHTMDTETRLNDELMRLNSHIVELNSSILQAQDQLVEQQQRHIAQNMRASAREAEERICFSKESVRAHLQRNGVKCFHWEDLQTLMKKLEHLHQQPDKPICYVSDVLDKTHIHATHPPLTQQHLQQLNTSVRSADGQTTGQLLYPTTPTAAAATGAAAVPSSGSRAGSASKGRRSSQQQQQDIDGHTYDVGYRFSNHPAPRVRRPSFTSDTASRTSHTHSHVHSLTASGGGGGAAAGENKKFWHATGGVEKDDPFGDHKLTYKDVREVHRGIEERFEFFRNQPASFFEYQDKHSPASTPKAGANASLERKGDSEQL